MSGNYQFSINPPPSLKSAYALGACPACRIPINRGDLVTRVVEYEGIQLRPVCWKNGSFNIKCIGGRIVHKECYIDGFWTYEMAEQEADIINNLNDTDDGWSVYDSYSSSIESACFWSD